MIKQLLWVAKWWVRLVLLYIFVEGANNMYFHQDDIILLADVVGRFSSSLWEFASGHVIFAFKPIYRLEWEIFGLDFWGFLLVSVGIHFFVIKTAADIVFQITGSIYWKTICLLLLVINVNIYEILWMPSSQMMSISTLLAITTLKLTQRYLKQKIQLVHYLLLYFVVTISGFFWGTGLIIPLCFAIAYRGTKLTPIFLVSQLTLVFVYFSTGSYFPGDINLIEQLKFVFFGVSYSLLGRTIFPLSSRFFRFIAVGTFVFFIFKNLSTRSLLRTYFQNKKLIQVALLVIFGSYLLISISRWQFGLGQAGAPRYAYLPMVFLVVTASSALASIKLESTTKKYLLLFVFAYSLLSLGGFSQVTTKWTERPQKNRALFQYLQNLPTDQCLKNTFLPWYIVEVDRWTLQDIWPIFKKNFDPFSTDPGCVEIKRDKPIPWTTQ